MKNFGKKFTLIVLICAAASLPLPAQIAAPPNESTNQEAVALPPALESAVTNPTANPPAKIRKIPGPVDQRSRIRADLRPDSAGVFVGGLHPISVEIPQRGFGPSLATAAMILIGVMSPFVCIVIICWLFLQSRHRRNQMLHETMRMMIERGVPIPPELIVSPDRMVRRKARSDLRTGLVILFFGVGVTAFLIITHARGWPLGLIFILVGMAFLATWKLEKKDAVASETAPK